MRLLTIKAAVMLLICLISCKQRDITIDVVRQSSDLMNCTKVFGYSAKKIEEENEILIQTGVFYAAGEGDDRQAAIIKVNHAERVLYLVVEKSISGEKTELYEGEGYSLALKYIEKPVGNHVIYDGRCRIRKGLVISEYNIEGEPNIHNY